MTDIKTTTDASDTRTIAGGNPNDNRQIVTCDQSTITGDGSVERPLVAIGGAGVGPGTTNQVAKFIGSNTIGNSQISDDGTNVAIVAAGAVNIDATTGSINLQAATDVNITSVDGPGVAIQALNSGGVSISTAGGDIDIAAGGSAPVNIAAPNNELSLFGVPSVTQQANIPDAAGSLPQATTAINAILALLQAYGLMAPP